MLWHAYNSLNGECKTVATADLCSFLTSLKDEQAPYIFLWKEDWAEWRAFLEVDELVQLRAKIPAFPPRGMRAKIETEPSVAVEAPVAAEVFAPTAPTVAPPAAAPTSAPLELAIPIEMPKSPPVPARPAKPPPGAKPGSNAHVERRKAPRVDAALNVIITSDGAVFRTLSMDISVGGLQLEKPVPESMLRKPVQIVISSPSMTAKLRLNAILVGDVKDARRFQFHEATQVQTQQIEHWIREIQALMRNSA